MSSVDALLKKCCHEIAEIAGRAHASLLFKVQNHIISQDDILRSPVYPDFLNAFNEDAIPRHSPLLNLSAQTVGIEEDIIRANSAIPITSQVSRAKFSAADSALLLADLGEDDRLFIRDLELKLQMRTSIYPSRALRLLRDCALMDFPVENLKRCLSLVDPASSDVALEILLDGLVMSNCKLSLTDHQLASIIKIASRRRDPLSIAVFSLCRSQFSVEQLLEHFPFDDLHVQRPFLDALITLGTSATDLLTNRSVVDTAERIVLQLLICPSDVYRWGVEDQLERFAMLFSPSTFESVQCLKRIAVPSTISERVARCCALADDSLVQALLQDLLLEWIESIITDVAGAEQAAKMRDLVLFAFHRWSDRLDAVLLPTLLSLPPSTASFVAEFLISYSSCLWAAPMVAEWSLQKPVGQTADFMHPSWMCVLASPHTPKSLRGQILASWAKLAKSNIPELRCLLFCAGMSTSPLLQQCVNTLAPELPSPPWTTGSEIDNSSDIGSFPSERALSSSDVDIQVSILSSETCSDTWPSALMLLSSCSYHVTPALFTIVLQHVVSGTPGILKLVEGRLSADQSLWDSQHIIHWSTAVVQAARDGRMERSELERLCYLVGRKATLAFLYPTAREQYCVGQRKEMTAAWTFGTDAERLLQSASPLLHLLSPFLTSLQKVSAMLSETLPVCSSIVPVEWKQSCDDVVDVYGMRACLVVQDIPVLDVWGFIPMGNVSSFNRCTLQLYCALLRRSKPSRSFFADQQSVELRFTEVGHDYALQCLWTEFVIQLCLSESVSSQLAQYALRITIERWTVADPVEHRGLRLSRLLSIASGLLDQKDPSWRTYSIGDVPGLVSAVCNDVHCEVACDALFCCLEHFGPPVSHLLIPLMRMCARTAPDRVPNNVLRLVLEALCVDPTLQPGLPCKWISRACRLVYPDSVASVMRNAWGSEVSPLESEEWSRWCAVVLPSFSENDEMKQMVDRIEKIAANLIRTLGTQKSRKGAMAEISAQQKTAVWGKQLCVLLRSSSMSLLSPKLITELRSISVKSSDHWAVELRSALVGTLADVVECRLERVAVYWFLKRFSAADRPKPEVIRKLCDLTIGFLSNRNVNLVQACILIISRLTFASPQHVRDLLISVGAKSANDPLAPVVLPV
eukprot:ANDGO_05281.mRNA.1 hypothetical protein